MIGAILIGIMLLANLFILLYTVREGRDELGKAILYYPTFFTLYYLITGYIVISWIFDSGSSYQMGMDIVFASSLVFYVVLILVMRKRYINK